MDPPFCPNVLRSAFGPFSELPRWEGGRDIAVQCSILCDRSGPPFATHLPDASSLWDTSEPYSIPSCGGCPAPAQVAMRRATPWARGLDRDVAAKGRLHSLSANSRPVNGRGQSPRGTVCIWYASAIKMVEALEEALPWCPAGVGARLRPPPHILSRSAAYRLRE